MSSEPYIDGCRVGSYLSAAELAQGGIARWDIGKLASEFGRILMTPEESSAFDSLKYPLAVHRCGIGNPAGTARRYSSTTDMDVAGF